MVASDLALEIFGDFFVVWILSPKKTFTQAPKKGLSRAIEGLPQHVLQVNPLKNLHSAYAFESLA